MYSSSTLCKCFSLRMIIWSRHSRRSVPMTLSQIGFCHGLRGAVGVSSKPNLFICDLKSSLNILSLSLMTYLVVSSKANVSLSCWIAHCEWGIEVIPKCNILRLSCEIAIKTYIALKKIVRVTKKSIPTMCFAWFLRNVIQRCLFESSLFVLIIYFATVLPQTS